MLICLVLSHRFSLLCGCQPRLNAPQELLTSEQFMQFVLSLAGRSRPDFYPNPNRLFNSDPDQN